MLSWFLLLANTKQEQNHKLSSKQDVAEPPNVTLSQQCMVVLVFSNH